LTARDSEQNRALQKVFANLRKKGVRNLWLLPGEPQLKGRENGTVDGVHPTDLGYVRMAEYYFPLLRKVLSEERGR
jgi:lysophospholipase L1-like esterase